MYMSIKLTLTIRLELLAQSTLTF